MSLQHYETRHSPRKLASLTAACVFQPFHEGHNGGILHGVTFAVMMHWNTSGATGNVYPELTGCTFCAFEMKIPT